MGSRYQRAFIDFFEDQLVNTRYDLKALLDDYLFAGKEPLINCMISGRKYRFLSMVEVVNKFSRTSSHTSRVRLRAPIDDSCG